LTEFRREHVGFVFQAYNLLGWLTVEENIALPLRLAGRTVDRDLVREVAGVVELGVRIDQRPSQLSGGQQQRVALARALVTRPEVVFLDERTGALDTRTARQVLQMLRQAVKRTGQTTVMVTHDPVAASFAPTGGHRRCWRPSLSRLGPPREDPVRWSWTPLAPRGQAYGPEVPSG
jgi:putative ABC transport system ATP-binding protein